MSRGDDQDADLGIALSLFDGKITVRRNPGITYGDPAEGIFGQRALSADEEHESRSAIARLLLSSQPPEVLLERVAAAFAPNGSDAAGPLRADLKRRSPNRPRDEVLTAQIISEVVWRYKSGKSLEVAWNEVADKHGMPVATVKSCWERNSDFRAAFITQGHRKK